MATWLAGLVSLPHTLFWYPPTLWMTIVTSFSSCPPTVQDEMASGEAGRLYQVMAAMARPVRLTRGKKIDAAWTVQVCVL